MLPDDRRSTVFCRQAVKTDDRQKPWAKARRRCPDVLLRRPVGVPGKAPVQSLKSPETLKFPAALLPTHCFTRCDSVSGRCLFSSGTRVPELRTRVPELRTGVPELRTHVPELRTHVPELRTGVSESAAAGVVSLCLQGGSAIHRTKRANTLRRMPARAFRQRAIPPDSTRLFNLLKKNV
jgi:hypothetical protein